MAEYTKEPWQWLNYPDGRKLLTGRDRAVIHCPGPGPEMNVSPEDQALIAASPALRDALTRYRVQHDQIRWPHDRPCDCEICQQADEAIKAAKGQQDIGTLAPNT